MTNSTPHARVGVVGGSGLYEIDALENRREVAVDTPFGAPSDRFVVGTIGGVDVAFLPRHGRGHRLLPTEINFRANIWAFRSLGVEWLISASAVGSLEEDVRPLDVVVPDQFIDRTRHRVDTFFGDGLVAHVSLADPVCPDLRRILVGSLRGIGARVHDGGTYVCMEGPQFSTRAESRLFRSWGARVIGMTNMQEARLAREAEICYATLALVTDWDCWKDDEEPVSVDAVVERLGRNAETARRAVVDAIGRLPGERSCPCARALDSAVITKRELIPESTIERLGPVVRRLFGR